MWSAQLHARPITSPKLGPVGADALWYRYYAGYADAFVADVVGAMPKPHGVVLDPWNGSGTTTSVAAANGVDAHGFDLNPAAVVIAKARLLRSDVAASLLPLSRELLLGLEAGEVENDDLLLTWMTPRTVRSVRGLGNTIHRALVGEAPPDSRGEWCSAMSSLAALYYLAYFRVVRRALRQFVGSNPTWLRQRVDPDERVDLDLRTFRPWFLRAMAQLGPVVRARGLAGDGHGAVNISVADSGALPLLDKTVAGVITSPPYCTRIDYVIATLPELAALRVSRAACSALRQRMIGTPTMDKRAEIADGDWGPTAQDFLQAVRTHPSRASDGYYYSFFNQYFSGMRASLAEISRVVAPSHPITVVVQDSYYKDIHADIPRVITELSTAFGWDLLVRRDFQVRTKANINEGTRRYRDPMPSTEAVLVFSR